MIERFKNKIDRENNSGCHVWTACKNNKGYGKFSIGSGKWILAHRVSYEISNGPIPYGMLVLHVCDNPACVNPEHLFLGTTEDNGRDMAKKGRARGGPARSGTMSNARLIKPSDVAEIRESKLTASEEARKRGVSNVTIYNIRKKKTWRDVA